MKKITVYQSDFHGGSEISKHKSVKEAIETALKHSCKECKCGGPRVALRIYSDYPSVDLMPEYFYYKSMGLDKAQAIQRVSEYFSEYFSEYWKETQK